MNITPTTISLYLLLGIIVSALIDYAYMQRDRGDDHFKDVTGEQTNITRLVVIIFWPYIFILGFISAIKQLNKKDNDGK